MNQLKAEKTDYHNPTLTCPSFPTQSLPARPVTVRRRLLRSEPKAVQPPTQPIRSPRPKSTPNDLSHKLEKPCHGPLGDGQVST